LSPWVHPPNGIADAAKEIWRSVRAVGEAICRPVICREFLRGVGPFVQRIKSNKITAKLYSQGLGKTACKTMIEKLLIISHGNTVPLMARVDVIKGKPPRNRKSADADQHCLTRAMGGRVHPRASSGFGLIFDISPELIQFR
jgi:hypothetical protein